jgi:hypothetical protein
LEKDSPNWFGGKLYPEGKPHVHMLCTQNSPKKLKFSTITIEKRKKVSISGAKYTGPLKQQSPKH